MKFIAEINVMPHKGLLDPQGKAVTMTMKSSGFAGVDQVRIGKHISFEVEAASEAEAKGIAEEACKKVLANLVMETYEISLHQA